MKVRHKRTGEVLDLEKLWRSILSDQYEEVQETADRWQDVTGACGFQEGSPREVRFFQHRVGTPDWNTLFEWPYLATIEGYRLRKVQVPNHGSGMSSYFLVERKVSP